VCRAPASIAAFVEHCYQEALATIEENKSVVLALTQALINHPERTLKAVEIDKVISETLAREAMAAGQARRGARLTNLQPRSQTSAHFVLYKHSIPRGWGAS
jgi:hypothetical protein